MSLRKHKKLVYAKMHPRIMNDSYWGGILEDFRVAIELELTSSSTVD